MIYGLAIAMESESTVDEIIHAVAPHPTKSEALHEASLAAFGLPIHIYNKK
jgi:dihydrolipoamide dehydrogenase